MLRTQSVIIAVIKDIGSGIVPNIYLSCKRTRSYLKELVLQEKQNPIGYGSLHDESNNSSFLDYAFESVARILNMVPTNKVEKTPNKVWYGQTLKLSYLKVWGCEVLVKRDTLTKPDKLKPRSIKCIFVGYPKETMGYSFYYPPENKVFVSQNAEFFKNSLITHEAIRSLEDLEIIQEEDTHPSKNTSSNHNEQNQEIDEPKAKEYEFGNLNEPANYKAALLDLESDKWLNAMNVKMQSMKDNENLGELHWTAVKNILKYLCNTKDMFLVYGGDIKRVLRVSCYTDAGYLTDADDLKSQTGYVFVLNGDASKEVVWVIKFIVGLGVGITKGARHYRAKVHNLREVIEYGDFKLEKVHTDDNLADPFTKALAFPKHSEDTKNIGMLLPIEYKLNYLELLITAAYVPVVAGQKVPPETLAARASWDKRKVLAQTSSNRERVSTLANKKKDTLFVQNYNMYDMEKTVNELHAMLKLHEQTLPKRDAPALHAIRAGKEKLNPIGYGRSMMSQTTLPLSFWDYALESVTRILNMVPTKKVEKKPYEVWYGQAIKQSYLKVWGCEALVMQDTLTKPDKLGPRSIKYIFVGYLKETMGYSFYYPPENKVFVAQNAKFFENSLITQEASGSLEDLKIIQEEDMHPSKNTSLNHDEENQEIDEPQSDIIPIRRSTRTRHALYRMCLNINEYELGDLIEPANNKAALLDPESDKWLNAMNVEMKSMKDNEVWYLVDLPPNGKTVGSKWLFKKKTDMDGVVHTYKAYLVAKGFTQTPGIDYEETFSLVADIRAIRILIAIAVFNDYMFLAYGGDINRELRVSCYTDAGYLTDAGDLKSHIRYVFLLNGDTTKEAVWVRKFIDGLGVVPIIKEPIQMYCDNTRAITMPKFTIYKSDDDWEGVESSELDEAFSAATAFVAATAADKEKNKVSSEVQLELYNCYKIATKGPCTAPQPFALKFTAWAK
nr:Gag/Pol protein [Tanacetum cinerariifolium]